MRPIDKLFWSRVGLGLLAGFLSGLLGFLGPNAGFGILLALSLYIASYYLAKYGLRISLSQQEGRKLLTAGMGSYILLFLFSWTLYNTFITFS